MPNIVCASGPTPVIAGGVRPPAVAGKFYPAEDAARRAMVKSLSQSEVSPKEPLAIMVPHAGLKYSGQIASTVWRSVASLAGRTAIVISPKHTRRGINWSICPFHAWRLSDTVSFDNDPQLVRAIADTVTPLFPDAAAHEQEHGIEVQLPILESVAPDLKIVGLALGGGSWPDIQQSAKQMAEVIKAQDQPPLLVISSDMNHYAPDSENRRRDRLALDAMSTGDPEKLIDVCRDNEVSMCGLVPAAFVMETLHQMGTKFRVEELAYATSGDVSGDKSSVVGYAGSLLLPVGE